jgi:endonuclease I
MLHCRPTFALNDLSMGKFSLLIALLIPVHCIAQPAGYYNAASGKSGEPLRRALYDIIKGHNALSYTPGLWNAYYTTDVKPDGKLATIYSDKPGSMPPYEFTLGTQQCSGSSPSGEGGCYNREHTWPQSKFGSAAPMYTDLWIVYPTDYYVNSQRSDWPYGKVISATKTFMNGSKLGPNTFAGAPATTAFEPIDSFKGDIARTYFYITTRYLGDSASFNDWEMAVKSTLKPWAIQMLLEWHHNDPVSAKERSRNEAVYALQNNRNPFIDEPRFADCIWAGNCAGLSVPGIASAGSGIRLSPNPAHTNITIDWQKLSPDEVLAVDVLNVQGQVVYHLQDLSSVHAGIDVAAWPRGLYIVRMRTQRGVQAKQVVVE